MTIGQIAREAGVGVETVRFYEREGLIEKPPRPSSGRRQYPEDVIYRLQFIRRAQKLGFSLKEIEELIALRLDRSASRSEVKARAEAKIRDIEEKLRDLQRMKDILVRLTGACDGEGFTPECPILESLSRGDLLEPIASGAESKTGGRDREPRNTFRRPISGSMAGSPVGAARRHAAESWHSSHEQSPGLG